MTSSTLSTPALLELLDLFERAQDGLLDSAGQRLFGVPAWAIRTDRALSPADLGAWTTCVGYAGYYPAWFEDERVPVELEETADPAWYEYRCPETCRHLRVAAQDVAVLDVRGDLLVNLVADLLAIPGIHRPRQRAPQLAGALWPVGKASIGLAQVETWLVRDLLGNLVAFLDHFADPRQPPQGLVLSAGLGLPPGVLPPPGYRVVALHEVLIPEAPRAAIDVPQIQRILGHPPGHPQPASDAVQFDALTGTLTIRNQPAPWIVKGKLQAKAIRYLFEQYCQGRHQVPQIEILTVVYGSQERARNKKLDDLFKGSKYFDLFVSSDGKGHYGFRLD